MREMDIDVTRIDGAEFYDYSVPINTAFKSAALEASNNKNDLKWFKSKVNHKADWDIKREEPWEKTIGTPFPGSYDTKIVVNGSVTTPEKLGNIMYGYTGTSADISELVLIGGSLYAAGFWDVLTDKGNRTNEFGDHDSIRTGIDWYNEEKEAK